MSTDSSVQFELSYGEETVQVNLVNQLRYLSAYDD